MGRLLGRVRDYTPRAPRRRRAKANAAGVPKTPVTKKRQQWKRASSRSFAARENRTNGRTPTWTRLRSDLAGRRGLKVLSTCTRARFERGGATTNALKKNNNFVDLRLEKATTSMTSPFRGPQSLSPVLLRQSLKCKFCRLRTCAVGRDPERNFRRQTDPSGWKTNLRKPSRCQGSRLKGTDRCFAAKRRFFRVRLCATGESDRR